MSSIVGDPRKVGYKSYNNFEQPMHPGMVQNVPVSMPQTQFNQFQSVPVANNSRFNPETMSEDEAGEFIYTFVEQIYPT